MQFLSSFFSVSFASVFVVHPYSCIGTTAAWKKSSFILTDTPGFYMIDSLSIPVHVFAWLILTPLLVDEMLPSRYVGLSTNFRRLPFRVEMDPSRFRHMYSILFAFTWRLCSRDPAWVGVFARSAVICIVSVRYSLCGISSASCLFKCKAIFFY